MSKKLILMILFVLSLAVSAPAQVKVVIFSDDFEAAHDYVADNVAGTGWDGYFGWLPGESVDALNANMAREGQLYIESSDGTWDAPWDPLAPFLYKYIEGDFIATVRVSDYAGTADSWVFHNDGGLMARASKADPNDEAGPGEDWVSIDYFPIWNCGNFLWTANNNVRTEHGHNGKAFNLDPYLQLEREGNTFYFRTSPDGVTWTEMANSPITRDDFDGLPLQVGLRQAIYNSGNSGYVAFDDFVVEKIIQLVAYDPVPTDNAVNIETDQDIAWSPGDEAVLHDVYFGSSFDEVDNADTSTAGIYQGRQSETTFEPGPLTLGQTYYWRIDEVNDADSDSPWKGPVWSFRVKMLKASESSPGDGAQCVSLDIDLSWTAGAEATSHWVYFGTTETPEFKGPMTNANYSPPQLEPDTLYYWRVDEKNGADTWPGDLWTFRTVPSVPIADPSLLGWWKLDEACGESTTILDSSGNNNHGTILGDVQYVDGFDGDALQFDGRDDYVELPIGSVISSLTSSSFLLWVDSRPGGSFARAFDFNNGQDVFMCLGPRWWFMDDMYFAITTDGAANQFLVQPTGFDIETGWHHIAVTIDADTDTMILYYDGLELARTEGAAITPSDLGETSNNWLGRSHDPDDSYYLGSMDDFRIYNNALSEEEIARAMKGDPFLAWNPSPASGSTQDAEHVSPLVWSPGDNASQHDVYLGTDAEAVEQADASDTTGIYLGRQDANSYSLSEQLVWGQTYYWRIDEYNTDETISKGRIWNFTVADYLVVDNFELYNDLEEDQEGSKLIYMTWIDGFDNPSVNGSTMGYVVPFQPSIEFDIVHGGYQSAPFSYDNSTASYSEITVSTNDLAVGRDWTKGGVQVMTLWFYGDPDNAITEQLYFKLNGVKVNYDGDAANLATAEWTQWDIDLSAFGINLANVTELSIGLERIGNSNGTGMLLLDDIRLYIAAP
jgi:hypothetical protein